MIRRLTVSALVLGAGAVVAACSDTPTPTAMAEPVTAFDVVDSPPSSSGPIVIRTEGTVGWLIVDPRTGKGAVFGADLTAICNEDPNAYDQLSITYIDVPTDASRVAEMIRAGDVRASLWDPPVPFDCEAVLANDPVATGTAHMVSTDNDLYADGSLVLPHPNSNAFGLQVEGTLQTPTGGFVQMAAFSRCVWDGSDVSSLRCVDRVNVH